jgi:hypothetical protein
VFDVAARIHWCAERREVFGLDGIHDPRVSVQPLRGLKHGQPEFFAARA